MELGDPLDGVTILAWFVASMQIEPSQFRPQTPESKLRLQNTLVVALTALLVKDPSFHLVAVRQHHAALGLPFLVQHRRQHLPILQFLNLVSKI